MQQAFVLTATLTDAQTLKLDEALPVQEGKVRVVVEVLPAAGKPSLSEVLARIHQGQRERGFTPRTREEVDAYLKAERESWDDE
jgi:hypothetical protein